MKNILQKIWEKIQFLFGKDKVLKQDELEGRITNSLGNLKGTIKKFKNEAEVIKGAFTIAEKSEEKGKKKLEDFFSLLQELEVELTEVQELVKINDKIKRYLFKPIQRTQRTAMWVAIVFGVVGAILKGPEFADWFQSKFTQKAVAPSYYENLRLQNIRSYMNPELYPKAIERINDLIETSGDPKIRAQAEVYRSVIYLNSENTTDEIDIWKEIQSINESGDSFLEGKKLLLTGIYHLKKGNTEECESFLRKVETGGKYGDILQLESYYYQMVSLISSEKLTESEKVNISNDIIKRLQEKLKTISPEFVFVDMSSGEKRIKNEIEADLEKRIAEEKAKKKLIEAEKAKQMAEEERIRKAEEEAQIREEKRKELYRQFKNLKVGIIYNRFKLNGRIASNRKVVAKANDIRKKLTTGFPEMANISKLKPLESNYVNQGVGYQKDNYYFNPNNEAASLLFEEMKEKKIIISWQFDYERLLRDRYPDYDFIILLAK